VTGQRLSFAGGRAYITWAVQHPMEEEEGQQPADADQVRHYVSLIVWHTLLEDQPSVIWPPNICGSTLWSQKGPEHCLCTMGYVLYCTICSVFGCIPLTQCV
jgi:hypothetical protein